MPTREACERAAANIRNARAKKQLSHEQRLEMAKENSRQALRRGEKELAAKTPSPDK